MDCTHTEVENEEHLSIDYDNYGDEDGKNFYDEPANQYT
jgi:hypothetical protein